ncbi:NADP-dependent oxidoreductase domain [Pseudocohnilembus persalinus]|uniref:NADP-dependent oxidoreductase domain n=1 Tax=Pseudocohnilembus persalinus TaxID=266149 RepID=A0A0V0R216_PSEPJ|nr:NADP-dependent oxidoreductase domain [Pseudocohnilembus persalinus]|eukprot:KRX08569.1 NADP-dependent oxidoreductase domain [Pseudocohnilembus persalinus]
MKNLQAPLKILSNKQKIPTVGLGLYKTDKDNFYNLLQNALQTGYTHFDSAILYKNEDVVGNAFQKIFSEKKFKRENIFITSKVFPNQGNIIENVEKSLKNLKLDYLDLYLIHWPAVGPDSNNKIIHRPVHQLWPELEQCVDKGLVKSIGVSNYNVQLLYDLLSYAKIKPVINQVELNLYLQQPDLLRFCQQFEVAVTAYSPLGQGKDHLENDLVVKLAKKYNKSPAQIILNHLNVNLGVIVIPKTSNIKRLSENLDFTDFKMQEDEIQALKDLDKNQRINDPRKFKLFGNLPLFH